ncbi:MAG TPA: diacylglycerol kinase family protein [Bryobacteraceae bacterium]|nr:diacylglycerol kinase family protein [Bryobacteraceae bacterium]
MWLIATYRNAFLIYNPYAGKLRGKQHHLQRTIDDLAACGHGVTAVATTGPNAAGGIARSCLERGADLILAAGGDGTINEVLNGMVHSQVPLGVLPAGTANVLAVELGIGKNMRRAAARLDALVPTRIALGLIENDQGLQRHFALMAGAGLDALIVYSINARLKAAIGKVAYWVGGFGHVGRPLTEFTVRVGGRSLTCSFALASRVRNYGGDLSIARNASLLRDDFEIVLFEGPHSLAYLKYFTGVLLGRLHGMKGVTLLRTQEMEMSYTQDPGVYVQIDGEYVGRLPARLRIVPDSLTLLAPPEFAGQ